MIEYFETLELIADSQEVDFDKEDFAKQLGVKSDSVGWMRLDVGKGIEQLRQISEFAKKNGVKLRGVYEKTAVNSLAKWYRFSPKNDFSMSDYSYVILGRIMGICPYFVVANAE